MHSGAWWLQEAADTQDAVLQKTDGRQSRKPCAAFATDRAGFVRMCRRDQQWRGCVVAAAIAGVGWSCLLSKSLPRGCCLAACRDPRRRGACVVACLAGSSAQPGAAIRLRGAMKYGLSHRHVDRGAVDPVFEGFADAAFLRRLLVSLFVFFFLARSPMRKKRFFFLSRAGSCVRWL